MQEATRNLILTTATLKDAMSQLDQGVGGVLFCIDESGVMQGLLTDGDIRRALLKGSNIDAIVNDFMNRDFARGRTEAKHEENLKLLSSRVRHLPILDEKGRPCSMLSWSDLWSLPVTTPSLAGNELKYVADCIKTVWVSSQGGYIDKFQNAFTSFHGDGYALCTSSGTTALQLAIVALGIGPGDEVIVPDITFGASANAVLHSGARPVFVDIDPNTKTIDVSALTSAITPKTRAIMPVHLYGHPCDMDPILALARKHNLKIIEDCAEALGAEYKGKKVGLFGDVGCFSFFANKVITTGEGGMVLCRDPKLLERMQLYRDHGMSKDRRYWHLVPGYNFRMTNLQAALGLAQMERIDHFLEQRERVVECYNARLRQIAGILTPVTASWARNIHWLYSIEVEPGVLGLTRDELAQKLHEQGVETRPVFPPLHQQPAFDFSKGSFPAAEHFARHGLSLPTANALTVADTERVCDRLEELVRQVGGQSGGAVS